MSNMKRVFSILLGIWMCMCLIVPVNAVEMDSEDDYQNNIENELDKVNLVYNDPNSTMCDIIRVTNPEAYATMTEEQKADFDAIRYQDVKKNADVQPVGIQFWSYNILPAISNPQTGTLKYGCAFFSYITPGTLSADCSFIGLTCSVIDTNDGNKRIAFESESDYNTDEVDLESTTKITAGHRYENECEAYGYDPTGEPFVIYKSIAMTAY